MVYFDKIDETIAETKRFLSKMEELKAHQDLWGNQWSASANRASLDLTQQLAVFRGTSTRIRKR